MYDTIKKKDYPMGKTSFSNTKAVTSWQSLFAYFIKNITKVFVCCLIAVPCVFGIDYFFFGRNFDTNYEKWTVSYKLENAKLDSLKMQLASLETYKKNSPLFKINQNQVAHTVSVYKIMSEDESFVSENINAESNEDYPESKVLKLNSSILPDILNEPISSESISDLISFTVVLNYIYVDIIADEETKALDWDQKIGDYFEAFGNIEKISSFTSVSFNKNVDVKKTKTTDKINDISDLIITTEKNLGTLLRNKPVKFSLLRDLAIGLVLGFGIAFLFFSYYPTISGKLCSSRDISFVSDAPSFGTLSLKGNAGICNSIVGEKVFSSKEKEDEYISSCIKKHSSGKSTIVFISCEKIAPKERLATLAKDSGIDSIFLEDVLLNPVLYKSLSPNQIIVLVAYDFKTTIQNINDIKNLLKTCGNVINGIICVL